MFVSLFAPYEGFINLHRAAEEIVLTVLEILSNSVCQALFWVIPRSRCSFMLDTPLRLVVRR
jgi:hypothetical protein